MIDELLKKDNIRGIILAIEISLFSYILLTQISHTKEIAELKMSDSFVSQQLNRIEVGQNAMGGKIDNLNTLVLRNLKITNG